MNATQQTLERVTIAPIHTPGPWHQLHPVGSDDFNIQAWDRRFTASIIRVAYVPNTIYRAEHGWPEHNERCANARLIAASPVLLAAAIQAMNECADLIGTPAGNALSAAIFEATGQDGGAQ